MDCAEEDWKNERQLKQVIARTENSEAKFSINNKSRFAYLNEIQQVMKANKGFVTRSVHDKMNMTAKAAMNKEIAEQKKVEERKKRLQKALACCCPHAITH